ncbi:MAG: mannose-6-phosphate isomerase, class I [Chloroflexi bacterium]|nr:MAG: mannose-6-phosphate isomerase, class I [Chloroflexota bacterium]
MNDFLSRPFLLHNSIQHYPWGERGKEAYIPRLLELDVESEATPFAELWIGTHPSAPSKVVMDSGQDMLLSELIQKYPTEILGASVQKAFNGQLPFLLKVLSAREILSIQMHPNKEQAQELHNQDPKNYPDTNHKPEIAIALDSLTALVGLIDDRELPTVMKLYPELRTVTAYDQNPGQTAEAAFKILLQTAEQNRPAIAAVIESIRQRLLRKSAFFLLRKEKLFLEYAAQYPGDVGLLTIFLLKLYTFARNQAVFTPPDIPHAYVKGNIIECMASSDNVVRVGLTNKYKDIKSLLNILDARQKPQLFRRGLNFLKQTYSAPASEYRVTRQLLLSGQNVVDRGNGSLRIFIVTRGTLQLEWQTKEGTSSFELHKGQSVLVPAILDQLGLRSSGMTECFKVDVPAK